MINNSFIIKTNKQICCKNYFWKDNLAINFILDKIICYISI